MPLRNAFRSLTLVAVVSAKCGSSAFITPHPRANANKLLRLSSDDGEPLFFDDFGDFDSGSSSSNSNSNRNLSTLQSRVSQVKGAEAAYDAKLARNWRRGNWSVRGFALDKASFTSSADTADEPVRVSVVSAPPSSSFTDITLPQDRALPSDHTVAVGRTDGSVFIVKLGDQYLTSFVSVPKGENQGQLGGADEGISVENEWMDSNDLRNRLFQGEQSQIPDAPMGAVDGDQTTQQQSPFEIKHQFLASERREPINTMAFDDAIQGNGYNGIVCTAAGSSGDISVWPLPSQNGNYNQMMEATILSGVHSNEIVSLETMILQPQNEYANEQHILFSASRDGTFALWDLDRNGELICSFQCMDVISDSSVSLTCADVSNPTSLDDGYNTDIENGNDFIIIGTSNGYVIGYAVKELLASAAGSEPGAQLDSPTPNLRFRAHGNDTGNWEAVTAIKCGGDGTIPTSARPRSEDESQARESLRRGMSSSILLTGGEDGSVKQWEILSQKSSYPSGNIRMEHWPRLPTQRMKRRSHIFRPGHEGPVSSIAQQSKYDSSKFLTCGQDGSVCVWNASSGKELYRMEGFSNSISSLACLGRELLVTDGMDGYVCVHDFGIEEDAADNGYDLEW
eukprot:CAMPEP_0183713902 /NCGR_PEP_ID=MMETSP0737-20130205/8634_1 /TAXON_ID=385413 /ORGANISM="Thalassiosira miniscula, Strain CCMP1093" /LENGTH=623 /DNA_ID=CAMNT_0025942775 /DNA_START=102 /DNA_END=1970 /DNA_ORIENTATION=+